MATKKATVASASRSGSWLVYSTMTCPTNYTEWFPHGANDLPRKKYEVTIRGGAGVADRRTFVTHFGVSTEVTDAQMDFLKNHVSFRRDEAAGWLKVIRKSGWLNDPDVIAGDLNQRDGSSPMVPADIDADKRPELTPINGVVTPPSTKRRSIPFPSTVNNQFM